MKEVVTFMVMHDLDIQPMSTIKSNVITKDSEVGALQEKVVQLGITEVCIYVTIVHGYCTCMYAFAL